MSARVELAVEREIARPFELHHVSIFHIGSTSIPAVGGAKPVIDVLLAAPDLAHVDRCTPALAAAGFEARGEYGSAGRRYFHSFGAAVLGCLTLIAAGSLGAQERESSSGAAGNAGPSERCENLAEIMRGRWPDPSTSLSSVTVRPAGRAPKLPFRGSPLVEVPEHCEVVGRMQERRGSDGETYAIRFRVRMPGNWNHRLLMEGGGGLNGVLGDAIGGWGVGSAPPALARGYAVLSQDSGHDGQRDPTAFGRDAQARANYGGASLSVVVQAAKALVRAYYGTDIEHSYFTGCSKGGQEGVYLAQRHPELFDGIIAWAPGISLPRTSLAQMWELQQFAWLATRQSGAPPTPASIAMTFSDDQLKSVSRAVLEACDADDGAIDGIVGNFPACTSAKVLPALRKVQCAGDNGSGCLSADQVRVLQLVHDGARDTTGAPFYPGYPWDAGWSELVWRLWKMGSADGRTPAINLTLVAPAHAMVFSTPPKPLAPGPEGSLAYALGINILQELSKIYATAPDFPRSSWEDVNARSSDLGTFRARGGKLIVPHGVSDAIFSIEDALQWWHEVDRKMEGQAASTVRVFPVPGMGHCLGGPATSDFDTLTVMERWVEHGEAPDYFVGRAGEGTPWPGRTRPICAYPKMARYKGRGDLESAASFECR